METYKNANGSFVKKRIYFSQVSNVALRDEFLSLKAKGLYALIQSYITREDYTLFKKTLFENCKDKEKSFEGAWSELKTMGYLKQYRIRVTNKNGKEKISNNGFIYQYELLDEPDLTRPALISIGINGEIIPQNQQKIVLPQNGGGTIKEEKEEEIVPPLFVGGTNGTAYETGLYSNTTTSSNTIYNQSIYQYEEYKEDVTTTIIHENEINKIDKIDKIDYKKIITEKIEYEKLKQQYGEKSILENIYQIILDTLEDKKGKVIKLGNDTIDLRKLKLRLLNLSSLNIQYVINSFDEVTHPIKNIDNYLLKSLYNIAKTENAYYTNMVNYTYDRE